MDLKSQIQKRMAAQAPFGVWTPTDFLDIGSRDAIDQALSRMTSAGEIRRITRGLYDLPRPNSLTGKPTNPDPRRVIDALARRDQARMLVDGLTAANDLMKRYVTAATFRRGRQSSSLRGTPIRGWLPAARNAAAVLLPRLRLRAGGRSTSSEGARP